MRYSLETCRDLRARAHLVSQQLKDIEEGHGSMILGEREDCIDQPKSLGDLIRKQVGVDVREESEQKHNSRHFKRVMLSNMASYKILQHALKGGDVEIMGMLVGSTDRDSIIVFDCYPLPVEGTETRVNAQLESYEYMVQYMNEVYDSCSHPKNIVGWYHSHPGYGCWLSGIDVQTQELNQTFQDPYIAVVVDPKKSAEDKRLSIGAFRTLNEDEIPENVDQYGDSRYGHHSHKYYELEVKIFTSIFDTTLEQLQLRFDISASETPESSMVLEQLLESVRNWNNFRKLTNPNQFLVQNSRQSDFSVQDHEVDMGAEFSSFSRRSSRASSVTSSKDESTGSDVDMISNAIVGDYSTESSLPPASLAQPGMVTSEVEVPQVRSFEREYYLYKTNLSLIKLKEYERLRYFKDTFTL
ncbi:COP9 signalosome catalytic subunit RRI1 [Lachancea thermotolerans CBS 6340]|uniref:COP9 signalosome complex subunit 5 n=1 Tax=Lachancea thermotolerans (strain ATCC 56472 / CBS 6340 / NRRL Y-8284) TaxID=559295 RepID=C5DD01_LACTC|nr:KLTH0B07194p [Lachancea thermotolerans CBS 6340]CAR21662.1 KLTH0B07194p [Lachancea thermotolerans CBS 6340]